MLYLDLVREKNRAFINVCEVMKKLFGEEVSTQVGKILKHISDENNWKHWREIKGKTFNDENLDKHGIYFLAKSSKIIYVGISRKLRERITQHFPTNKKDYPTKVNIDTNDAFIKNAIRDLLKTAPEVCSDFREYRKAILRELNTLFEKKLTYEDIIDHYGGYKSDWRKNKWQLYPYDGSKGNFYFFLTHPFFQNKNLGYPNEEQSKLDIDKNLIPRLYYNLATRVIFFYSNIYVSWHEVPEVSFRKKIENFFILLFNPKYNKE
jgi:hypothetical protein